MTTEKAPVTPPTPEEIAGLRALHVEVGGACAECIDPATADRDGWGPHPWPCDAARLLAALASPSPEPLDELRRENERLRAAVAEGDRRIERLRESIHPTMDGYCPACGGGCLIGFATRTPARDAVREIVP